MEKDVAHRLVMENLPTSQDRVDLDVLANDVFIDAKAVGKNLDLHGIYQTIKELHLRQYLFIFSNGTVAATRKGLNKYE